MTDQLIALKNTRNRPWVVDIQRLVITKDSRSTEVKAVRRAKKSRNTHDTKRAIEGLSTLRRKRGKKVEKGERITVKASSTILETRTRFHC